ncbi:hypothetical protein [Salipaludibacillus daqingensis]|nr:hypothetical protein [Salipaludibacillus daqingensis]
MYNNKTIAGTDINEVKRLNNKSGLTFNEAKIALTKQKNTQSEKPKS